MSETKFSSEVLSEQVLYGEAPQSGDIIHVTHVPSQSDMRVFYHYDTETGSIQNFTFVSRWQAADAPTSAPAFLEAVKPYAHDVAIFFEDTTQHEKDGTLIVVGGSPDDEWEGPFVDEFVYVDTHDEVLEHLPMDFNFIRVETPDFALVWHHSAEHDDEPTASVIWEGTEDILSRESIAPYLAHTLRADLQTMAPAILSFFTQQHRQYTINAGGVGHALAAELAELDYDNRKLVSLRLTQWAFRKTVDWNNVVVIGEEPVV